jgi:hypothetical protein
MYPSYSNGVAKRHQKADLAAVSVVKWVAAFASFETAGACIGQVVPTILRPGDFSPHVAAPSLPDNKTESQLTEITQFILGQPQEPAATGVSKDAGAVIRPKLRQCLAKFAA